MLANTVSEEMISRKQKHTKKHFMKSFFCNPVLITEEVL